MNKRYVVISMIVISISTLVTIGSTLSLRQQRKAVLGATQENGYKLFSAAELAHYDATDADKPVYLALDGYVYDVSAGREEYYNKGKPYHELVGKDSSQMLHIAGADLIRKKYPVVGIYTP